MIKYIEVVSVIVTLVLSFVLGLISIEFLGEYGWTIFVLTPLIIGFLPPFIVSKYKRITKTTAYQLSFTALGMGCLSLLAFALEGIICIAMASPILGILTWLGSYLGYILQGNKIANTTNLILFLIIGGSGLMSFDYLNEPKGLIPITTTIIVDANINEVWHNVVTFDQIPEPEDWIFKTGIAYPTDATIEGTGVGAIRYCNFSTGRFVEPITTWDEPFLLQFSVVEQPIPMNEMNPFWDVHPLHLDGYFNSHKGQFKLTALAEDKTMLEGTTWYQVDITPEIYWKTWSNFVIQRIHKRVLNHIKVESEGS